MTLGSLSRPLGLLATVALVAGACGGTAQPSPTTSGGATAAPTAAPTARVLTRPVEFVISTAPGGGSDIYARQWISIMEKEKALSTSVLPVNKEGGAGAVAFTYVFEKKGDPHYIMVTLNSFFTTIITANPKLPYAATDFTPIANMALDPFFLWVNEDSPWKNAQDFIKAAQDKSITVAGTGSKQEDEVLFRRIQDLAKTKPFTYIPQSGGGTVATALAGHQGGVDATVNNPSEGLGLFTATPRKLRPLCAFTPASPTAGVYKDLATCKSQGLDITDYYIVRSVVGAPGVSATQTKFWADAFKKVFDSAEWKKFMSDNALEPDYRAGDDLKKLFEQYNQLHIDIAKKNGWT
jgi:tripartite-type tricarboxylate transporter receptor subunit TctC